MYRKLAIFYCFVFMNQYLLYDLMRPRQFFFLISIKISNSYSDRPIPTFTEPIPRYLKKKRFPTEPIITNPNDTTDTYRY